MNLQDIKTVLGDRAPDSLDSLYQSYFHDFPQANLDQFVAWLYSEKKIDSKALQEIHLLEPIEVTHIDLLSQSQLLEQQMGERPNLKLSEQYDFLGLLGQGAMGLVHKAKDKNLQRTIAYKQLLQEMAQNRGLLRRFLNEVQITAQLDHPNIVPIYNLDIRPDGSLAYAMKMVKGKTLKDLIKESQELYKAGKLPDDEHSLETLLDHFLKVCDAMAYAHSKQVIHRDLKPANIMIGEYKEVYVMDWGIAKLFQDQDADDQIELKQAISDDLLGEQTQIGQIVGTPRYMSPQQAAGKNKELDGRSDQFALGLILYELLTLLPAFKATGAMDLLKKVLKAEIEDFTPFDPHIKIPVELKAIVHKATAKKSKDRYASTDALAQDLRRYLHGEETEARPDNQLRKTLRTLQKHRNRVAAGVMLFLALSSTITLAATWSSQHALQISRQREAHLSKHLTEIARKTQQIDSEFLRMQGLLAKLVSATESSLNLQNPQAQAIFLNDDFSDPKRRPRDFHFSPLYQREISIDQAGFKLAPGVSASAVKRPLKQLAGLTPVFQEVFMQSPQKPLSSLAQLRKALDQQGVPLIWSYIGLEAGLHFSYPGKGGYKPSYDPRQRPWYKQALGKTQALWGEPYLDASGQGILLPCVQPILLPSGKMAGVAGIEMVLETWARQLLALPDMKTIENIYLLNQAGEIVVQTQKSEQSKSEKLQLSTYPHPEVLSELKQHPFGHLELKRKDQPTLLIAFNRLDSIGWSYVVEARASELYP
ncbi:hypothetical protein COW36_11095 [bacterium (Candidatus Blackallbacteria) CG17_big_fil_post_rev_8_21_14_2_50_48_46]|uniref:Protein kinase domain-containing protein n=1 Tax=bacterium (Candidatus Blackallbacteria) CG17_big_fil_post_rev_8_21_14_2_50_48_46 TaxID=2014261 RepID=A0A2M7G4W0_9BACT|nr:MAG: hypothetical protein COW64_18190 [bacterium (Candidatus Blackallbacteria) CG18_big_fil_WC_8_21_14_2_50_49_26]PIW16821.1 MAG: hypothetical protein COW36_11095 [bacterium (Candidatus Blackallbacteria) CG17_big_fil_post_rev_8_21_14_2_50_48_46]PIW48018.1 MAG: hypothetical protein COW20_10810 [bacterium (Candidatus Blackallbacteria) CG13_big_fil_rev_8_21_14_2_50_49_14]